MLKNEIEVAQFQSNSPKYLPISEEFWKALAKLPSVYDYSAYRKILERFGTHYVSEGSMGGSLNSIVSISEETEKRISKDFQIKKKSLINIYHFSLRPVKSMLTEILLRGNFTAGLKHLQFV